MGIFDKIKGIVIKDNPEAMVADKVTGGGLSAKLGSLLKSRRGAGGSSSSGGSGAGGSQGVGIMGAYGGIAKKSINLWIVLALLFVYYLAFSGPTNLPLLGNVGSNLRLLLIVAFFLSLGLVILNWEDDTLRVIFVVATVVAAILFFVNQTGLAKNMVPFQNNAEDIAKDTAPTWNKVKAFLAGDLDIETLWKSEEVESEYVVWEDAGVKLEDVSPARDFFYADPTEQLEVTGRVTVVSTFQQGPFDGEDTTLMEINVAPDCDNDFLNRLAGGGTPEEWCDLTGWTCTVDGEQNIAFNTFNMTRAYNKFFSCTNDALSLEKGIDTSDLSADVIWNYESEAVAGKQIYVTSPALYYRSEDLGKTFGIPKESTETWSLSDGSINIGMGLTKNPDFIQTWPEGVNDDQMTVHRLGISIENDRSGKISDIEDLTLIFPADPNIQIIAKEGSRGNYISQDFAVYGNEIRRSDSPGNWLYINTLDLDTVYMYKINDQDTGILLASLPLKESALSNFEDIEPGDHANYYIDFAVNEDFLKSTSYQSFFVQVNVTYTYSDSESVTIRMRQP